MSENEEHNFLTPREFKEAGGELGEAKGVLKGVTVESVEALDAEEAKQLDDGDGSNVLRFVVSTQSVDRDNDTIDPNGWEVSNYMKNPVVLWAHDYRSPPIGRSLQLFFDGGKMTSDAKFMPQEMSPFSDMVYRMYLGKFLNAVSAGFKPIEFKFSERDMGMDFLKQELLEYSAVPVPSNPEALVEARSKGIDTGPLREWAEKVLDGEAGYKSIIVPKDMVEEAYKHADSKGSVSFLVTQNKETEDLDVSLVDVEEGEEGKADGAGEGGADAEAKAAEWIGEKFPHHDGEAVDWDNLSRSMAVLLGAKGGIDLTTEQAKEVFDHLAEHYKGFEVKPPEFRFVNLEVLKDLDDLFYFDYYSGQLKYTEGAIAKFGPEGAEQAGTESKGDGPTNQHDAGEAECKDFSIDDLTKEDWTEIIESTIKRQINQVTGKLD